MKFTNSAVASIMLCSVFLILGCHRGPARYSAEGTVTLNGKPLEEGSICFRPIAGTSSPTAGAKIIDGKFVVDDAAGLMPGKFSVEITSARLSDELVLNDISGKMERDLRQFLPDEYNRNSKLTAEITPEGPNRFDFTLEMKEK